MKRTYIAPKSKTINLCGESIMAGSLTNNNDGTVTGSLSEETTTEGGFTNQQNSIWDNWD